MKIIVILLTLFIFIDLYPVVIKLKKEAQVCGLYIELGQIAEIDGKDELKSFKICKIPEKTMNFDSSIIRKILEEKLNIDFVLQGDSVLIKPLYTILLPQEIVEKIKSEAYKVYEYLHPEYIQIILTSPLKEIKIPQSDVQLKVYIPSTTTNKTKAARIEIVIDDQIYQSFLVTFNISIKSRVLKTVKNINKNTVFTKDLIKEEISEIYFNSDGSYPLLASDYKNFIGKKFKCYIKENDFIYEKCLK